MSGSAQCGHIAPESRPRTPTGFSRRPIRMPMLSKCCQNSPCSGIPATKIKSGAEGQIRTDTGFPPPVFETGASTISPLRHVGKAASPHTEGCGKRIFLQSPACLTRSLYHSRKPSNLLHAVRWRLHLHLGSRMWKHGFSEMRARAAVRACGVNFTQNETLPRTQIPLTDEIRKPYNLRGRLLKNA